MRAPPASVRATCACHSASEYGSVGRDGEFVGDRRSLDDANAAAAIEPAQRIGGGRHAQESEWHDAPPAQAPRIATSPAARASGGSKSHRPSHETVRNKTDDRRRAAASAGHSRSQKIVQRARRSAHAKLRASRRISAVRSDAAGWLDEVSVTKVSAEKITAGQHVNKAAGSRRGAERKPHPAMHDKQNQSQSDGRSNAIGFCALTCRRAGAHSPLRTIASAQVGGHCRFRSLWPRRS